MKMDIDGSPVLQELRKQASIAVYNKPAINDSKETFDTDRLRCGQEFFRRHSPNCILLMMCSLVYGLSVRNLLDPLVFTGNSDTPSKSVRRYLQTLVHVLKWHYGDIWEADSPARKSLDAVHNMHTSVCKAMNQDSEDDNVKYVTQYDMSLVQCGFIGGILMAPDKAGISCTQEELEDYVYFWRWIGCHLGISDSNNICCHGYQHARRVCEEIDEHVVYPALQHPPENFDVMARAFTDGINLLTFIPLFSYKSMINFSLDLLGRDTIYKLSFIDKARFGFLKFIVYLLQKLPWLKQFLNKRHYALSRVVMK